MGLNEVWSCRDNVLTAVVGRDLAKTIIATRPTSMPTGPYGLISVLGSRTNENALGMIAERV